MCVTSSRVHGARLRVRFRSDAHFFGFLFELCDGAEGQRSVQECCPAAPARQGSHGNGFDSRREPFFSDFLFKTAIARRQMKCSRGMSSTLNRFPGTASAKRELYCTFSVLHS